MDVGRAWHSAWPSPNAPNQPNFLSTVVRPGEIYRQTIVYRLSGDHEERSMIVVVVTSASAGIGRATGWNSPNEEGCRDPGAQFAAAGDCGRIWTNLLEPEIAPTARRGVGIDGTLFGRKPGMKFKLLPAATAIFMAAGWAASPAHAAGCLKGAAVGGVAGHVAGHHGVLGAGAGCIIGHHEASKHAKENTQQQQQGSNGDGQTNSKSGN
jgi:hypothetical protein